MNIASTLKWPLNARDLLPPAPLLITPQRNPAYNCDPLIPMKLSIGRPASPVAQDTDPALLGRVRARVFCIHADESHHLIAQVRGDTIIADLERFSLLRETSDVTATCKRCPVGHGQWVLDLAKIRQVLGRPHRGRPKVDVATVGRRVPADE